MALFIFPGIVFTYMVYWLLVLTFGCAETTSGYDLQRDSLTEDMDLVTFLNSKTQQHDAIFMEAVQLLETMKSSPSCNRLAASRLVNSCQSIEGVNESTNPDLYLALEHVRSLYAARLAICELNEAGASIPSPCVPVTSSQHHRKGIFGFSSKQKSPTQEQDVISKELLASCLKTLESRPQWWTSYSNSRQNALVICQAARVESEKNELLELYKSILEASAKLNSGLQEALRMAAAESMQHKAFMETTAIMRARLATELDETHSRFISIFESIFHDIGLGVNSMVGSVNSILSRVQNEAISLEKNVLNASEEITHLQHALKVVHDEALLRNQQMRIAYRQDSQTQNELASSIQDRLEVLLQSDIATLFNQVQAFDASVDWLSGRFGLLLQQETSISERLRNLENAIEKSQVTADDLHKSQAEHFETLKAQSQIQQSMQANMNISQAFMDRAAATAANLQAMIDEATASLAVCQLKTVKISVKSFEAFLSAAGLAEKCVNLLLEAMLVTGCPGNFSAFVGIPPDDPRILETHDTSHPLISCDVLSFISDFAHPKMPIVAAMLSPSLSALSVLRISAYWRISIVLAGSDGAIPSTFPRHNFGGSFPVPTASGGY
ncbi:hypothetical protein P170DRAFT_470736 [Aspergillus steynii IBT 23096]|uniref:Nuclear membrane fusion protein Kar5 n=1 Tax=Aspergillus steynii IBT 23096 TaxID=1392250 RepID=A0A2I2GR07_9EURO|nr:uncharacterized protein P170DRAFT_470736 [Aspergillus steynii IBT 23096]PLB55322.1 hypothetical protein P170DRAFT_470736 [Aspergillus steynii IBT 23096]